ncbi:unnamed protein product [Schistosoma turkestanicum]|nr:unnamed protein product [Schistosoma turkestanicum]
MTLSAVSDEAEAFKEEANKYFKDGDYDKAIEAYTKAIEIRETAVYLANRSLAYLRTECFGYALDDASKAIALDSSYVKGYYRRASAHMALGQYKEALADYETVIRVAPSDRMAREKLTECRKIIRRKAFEKAIAIEDQPSPIESFDLSTITVEASYDGPHLEQDSNGKYFVTESFMLALMEHYKSQKILHKKYAIIVKDEGYEVAHNGRCITVFSAPNYCDTMHNRGAFITLKGSDKPGEMAPKFTSFKEVPHPDVRPMAYVNPLLSMFM